jgi:hypothetical protein
VGFKVQHESGLELVGTGDSSACQQILLSAAFQSCDPNSKGPCYVDGVTHPPIDGLKFYGMSVYFYAFDCIRQLSGVDLPHWPTPTLTELQTAVTAFCHLSWDHVQNTMMPKGHAWTRDDQLSARCLETTYLITLLHHGFGVGLGDRNIELALEVKGFEVEWTLGFALSEVCLQCLDHHTETEVGSENEQSQPVDAAGAGAAAAEFLGLSVPQRHQGGEILLHGTMPFRQAIKRLWSAVKALSSFVVGWFRFRF